MNRTQMARTDLAGGQDSVWQMQTAKAHLSELVRQAAKEPQRITVRGVETAVVLSTEQYEALKKPKRSFYDFIRESPLYGVELELPERTIEPMREINL
jgi:prevent-host-death family protein